MSLWDLLEDIHTVEVILRHRDGRARPVLIMRGDDILPPKRIGGNRPTRRKPAVTLVED